MNCDEARRHWDLYHDSEGEAELCLRINEHSEECAACAEWFALQSRLEELIEERLRAVEPAAAGCPGLDGMDAPAAGTSDRRSQAPALPSGPAPATPVPSPELWEAVLARSGVRRRAAARRWTFMAALAALAACVLAAVVLWHGGSGARADLARVTADYHEQFAAGTKPVAFSSGSDLEVEQYLRGEVSFPVRCPPRKDSGFLVRGAGCAGSTASWPISWGTWRTRRFPCSSCRETTWRGSRARSRLWSGTGGTSGGTARTKC